LTFILLF